MKKFLISLFLLFFAIVSMADEMPMLLSELDKAIKERPLYIKKRLEYLERLNKMLDNSETNEQRYHILAYIIHSGFISGYQNRYGDNLKPPTNVYHRMTA